VMQKTISILSLSRCTDNHGTLADICPGRVVRASSLPSAITSYPVQLPLHYEILHYEMGSSRERLQSGEGCTVSMSRTEIVFEAPERVPLGRLVKLRIDWPAKIHNRINLTLEVRGKTVQTKGQRTTVEILRHEFRYRPSFTAVGKAWR
jgi:hypothetical protein